MTDTAPAPAATPRSGEERVWRIVALVAGLLLVAFILFVATRSTRPKPVAYPVAPVATLPVGSAAPAFALPRLGGGAPVTLASTRGTPTVVNFFASWCRDCQAELGDFAALAAHTSGRIDVIGIDANDADGAAAEVLLAKARASYPVGVDSQAATATSYLLTGLPVTFFLDAQGRVVHVSLGTQTLASLTRWAGVLEAGTAA